MTMQRTKQRWPIIPHKPYGCRGGVRFVALVAALSCGACSAPYRGAKIIGGIGGVLAVGGGTAWVVGENRDSNALILPGVIASVIGAAGMATAAMLVAAQSSCKLDADCTLGYMCRELPAPAGREPYSQCVPR